MVMTAIRQPFIDIIRGGALLGILIVNAYSFNNGMRDAISGAELGAWTWSDQIVDFLVNWLFAGKFILIFAFVMGWGIYTQTSNAGPFRARYLRRLLGLFLMGVVHYLFIFSNDILTVYAIVGLLMLRPIGRDWPVRRLVRSAIIIFGMALLVFLVVLMGVWLLFPGTLAGFVASFSIPARWELYRTGRYTEIVADRLSDLPLLIPMTALIYAFIGLPMIRVGFAAAKINSKMEHEAVRTVVRSTAPYLLMMGIVGSGATAYTSMYTNDPLTKGLSVIASFVFEPMLALGYLLTAFLLLDRRPENWLTKVLAAAGRMSLTNYVGQSVVMSLLFFGYGYGLSGTIGSAAMIVICLAVYAMLALFSLVWLDYVRIGPLEWLLRSMTEWRWGGSRHDALPAPVPDTASSKAD